MIIIIAFQQEGIPKGAISFRVLGNYIYSENNMIIILNTSLHINFMGMDGKLLLFFEGLIRDIYFKDNIIKDII